MAIKAQTIIPAGVKVTRCPAGKGTMGTKITDRIAKARLTAAFDAALCAKHEEGIRYWRERCDAYNEAIAFEVEASKMPWK
jgi:hypothetical protein